MKEYTSWIVLLSFFAISLIVIFILGLSNIRLISERDVLREEVDSLQQKVDSLGILALEANDQWIKCLNNRDEYIDRYRSIALNCAEELKFFRPESTQVVNGVLLERSNSSRTAWNDGVGK